MQYCNVNRTKYICVCVFQGGVGKYSFQKIGINWTVELLIVEDAILLYTLYEKELSSHTFKKGY